MQEQQQVLPDSGNRSTAKVRGSCELFEPVRGLLVCGVPFAVSTRTHPLACVADVLHICCLPWLVITHSDFTKGVELPPRGIPRGSFFGFMSPQPRAISSNVSGAYQWKALDFSFRPPRVAFVAGHGPTDVHTFHTFPTPPRGSPYLSSEFRDVVVHALIYDLIAQCCRVRW